MTLFDWLKLMGALSSFAAISKILYDIVSGKKAKLREEYRFAKEFLVDLDNDLHPYAKEKGYQALAGTTAISVLDIEYILTLKNSAQCLRNYVLAGEYLERVESMGNTSLQFKPKYQSHNKRVLLIIFYLLVYVVCFMSILSPIYLKSWFQLSNSETLIALAMTITAFPLPTWWSLKEAVKLGSARELVNSQKIHSWELVT